MSAPSFARRKAKKIGVPGDEDNGAARDADAPAFSKRPALKNKRVPSSRISLGVDTENADDDDSSATVFKPKKPGLGRQALERSAQRRSGLTASLQEDNNLTRAEDSRPSYSKEYLDELKSSTPATPKSEEVEPSVGNEIDIASKFGASLARYEGTGSSTVPTDAVIQEKKARRARLAKEQKYRKDSDSNEENSPEEHDSDDDEFRTQHDKISLRDSSSAKPPKYEETRLVRDDEDFMEEFDDYVDTGQVSLGRKADKAQRAKQREHIREMIEDAESNSDSEDSSDSDADARKRYNAAQTRRGMEGMKLDEPRYEEAQTPPKITPLPTLAGCREKIKTNMQSLESELERKLKELEEIETDKKEIGEREKDIQNLLNETAARYRQLVASGVLKDDHIESKLLTDGTNGDSMEENPQPASNGLSEDMEADESDA